VRVRVDLRLPAQLVERVEAERGSVSRTRFIERALEAALGAGVGSEPQQEPEGSANGSHRQVSSTAAPDPSAQRPGESLVAYRIRMADVRRKQ